MHERVELAAAIELRTAFFGELHCSVLECEKREITTNPYVVTRMPFGSLLAHEYATGSNGFSSEVLDSKAMRLRISSVSTRPSGLFM